MKYEKVFTGGLDSDTGDRFVAEGDYRKLENGIVQRQDGGDGFVVKNIKSSKLLKDLGLTGYKCIGSKEYKGYIYAFYATAISTDETKLYKIDKANDAATPTLLLSEALGATSASSVDIDLIENIENGDVLVYFTIKGHEYPFKVNASKLEADPLHYSDISSMYNIREVPEEPTITTGFDSNIVGSDVPRNQFRFASRYIYEDGEPTTLSSSSKVAYSIDQPDAGVLNSTPLLFTTNSFALLIKDSLTSINVQIAYEDIGQSGIDFTDVSVSGDGRIIILYSRENSVIPIISYDFGISYVKITELAAGKYRISISKAGKTIHAVNIENSDLYSSLDYGSSFSLLYDGAYNTYGFSTSCDGRVVALALGNASNEARVVISRDYGTTFEQVWIDENTRIQASVAVSPTGRNVFIGATRYGDIQEDLYIEYHISHNSGISFDEMEVFLETVPSHLNENPTWIPRASITEDGIVYIIGKAAYWEGNDDPYHYWTYFGKIENGVCTVLHKNPEKTGGTPSAVLPYGNLYYPEAHSIAITDNEVFFTTANYNAGITCYGYAYNIGTTTGEAFSSSEVYETNHKECVEPVFVSRNNSFNFVDVYINKPNSYVRSVELYCINVKTGSHYLIKDIHNSDIPAGGYTHRFSSIYANRVLASSDSSVLYSAVPSNIQHQNMIGSRCIYSNFNSGLPSVSSDFSVDVSYSEIEKYNIDNVLSISNNTITISGNDVDQWSSGDTFSTSLFLLDNNDITPALTYRIGCRFGIGVSTLDDFCSVLNDYIDDDIGILFSNNGVDVTISGGSGFNINGVFHMFRIDDDETWRKLSSPNVGIQYYDKYNRVSYPVFDKVLTIDNVYERQKASISVEISHLPPEWAVKYKFISQYNARRDEKIYGMKYVYVDNGYINLIPTDYTTYPVVGDILRASSGGKVIDFDVLKIESKDVDGIFGDWIVINDTYVNGFSISDAISGTSLFYGLVYDIVYSDVTIDEDRLFAELPNEYQIVGGFHTGLSAMGDQDQDGVTNATINIKSGDSFYDYMSGSETNIIDANSTYSDTGRVMIVPDRDAGIIKRTNGVVWSRLFVQDTGVNGLSMFATNDVNWFDLNVDDGAITGVKAVETDLFVWQENEFGRLLVNKDSIISAEGNLTISKSEEVITQFVSRTGEYGTLHPLSISVFGNSRFFLDANRGIVCRDSADGVTEISNVKYASEITNAISAEHEVFDVRNFMGVFNQKLKEYWLYDKVGNKIRVYNAIDKMWTRTIENVSVDALMTDGYTVYAFVDSKIHMFDKGTTYGNVLEDQKTFKLGYVENKDFGTKKTAEAMLVDGTTPTGVMITDGTLTSNMDTYSFENVDGYKMAAIPNTGGATDADNLESSMTLGLGVVDTNSGAVITLKNKVNVRLRVGSKLYKEDSGVGVFVGNVVSFSGMDITIDDTLPLDAIAGGFVFSVENDYINGDGLRGNSFYIEISDSGSEKVEIVAVALESNIKETGK